MSTPTDNHRLSVEPRLELVGGEWEEWGSEAFTRVLGPFRLEAMPVHPREYWHWRIKIKGDTYNPGDPAPTREDAIAAAEAALLGEIGKFVRVKQ